MLLLLMLLKSFVSPDTCMSCWPFSLMLQVISNMRIMMTEDSSNAVSSSFLLDDDSRYCFYIILLIFTWFSVSIHRLNISYGYLYISYISMQHPVLRGWHLQVNATNRCSRRWSSFLNSWKLGVWVFTSTCWVMFMIMVLDAQILFSWLPMGCAHQLMC